MAHLSPMWETTDQSGHRLWRCGVDTSHQDSARAAAASRSSRQRPARTSRAPVSDGLSRRTFKCVTSPTIQYSLQYTRVLSIYSVLHTRLCPSLVVAFRLYVGTETSHRCLMHDGSSCVGRCTSQRPRSKQRLVSPRAPWTARALVTSRRQRMHSRGWRASASQLTHDNEQQ